MKLKDYMAANLVFSFDTQVDKQDFLKRLASSVAERVDSIDEDTLFERLEVREAQMSTGIGHGVAIPHATLEGLEATYCIVVQIPQGLDFQALDQSPVYLVFLLLSPPDERGTHLKLLARIARLSSNHKFVDRVIMAPNASEVCALVLEEDGKHV